MTIDIKALRALHDVARDVAATTSRNRHLALHDLADKLIWTGTDDPMKGDLPALLDAYEDRAVLLAAAKAVVENAEPKGEWAAKVVVPEDLVEALRALVARLEERK